MAAFFALPLVARLYVSAVVLSGIVTLALGLPHATFERPALLAALIVTSSAAAAMKIPLPLSSGASTMSVSYAIDFLALLLLGPYETMLVAGGSAISQCCVNSRERSPLYRIIFSAASLVLSAAGAGMAFSLLSAATVGSDPVFDIARALVGAATIYFLLNTGLVASAIALSTKQPVASTWQDNFLWSAPSYFVGALAAALAATVIAFAGYWMAPLAFAPLYLTYRTYKVYMARIEDEQRHVQQTSDLHLATIEALARAIDAKDQTAHSHIRRVQVYATGLAKAVGLSEPEIDGIRTASLLHDIGKLAVPEHILSKPGPLTHEEFQKIRIHPQVGAEIIAAVPFPYPVAPLILSHHERWDGKGYPQGLAGHDIPAGARILSIVDYYDAVTTDRPYHKALSHENAIGLLKHEAGRALDPSYVATFLQILPALAAEAGEPEQDLAQPVQAVPPRHGVLAPTPAAPNAFENIALAHREIYALYEIAQSMGTSLGVSDTMALISSKLTKIIPWTGCALFLLQPDGKTLRCRFSAGVDAPHLLHTLLPIEHGLAGWVARNRRTLVNAHARVTFEACGLSAHSLNSAIVCPLSVGDTLIGCLELYHSEANHYTEDHRRLLERVAEQAGPVIHNSIVFEQTQEDSLTDPLTSLPNRRSMFSHLSHELSRAQRMGNQVALIVLDVDEFKAINDTHGHHVGDRALREVAAALQAGLRSYDLCVRYAGDEFIVVLSGCTEESAELKRLELQAKIAEIQIQARSGKWVSLAASAGAAVFPQDGTTYESLIAAADQRMYRDKAVRRGALLASPLPADFAPADAYDQPPALAGAARGAAALRAS